MCNMHMWISISLRRFWLKEKFQHCTDGSKVAQAFWHLTVKKTCCSPLTAVSKSIFVFGEFLLRLVDFRLFFGAVEPPTSFWSSSLQPPLSGFVFLARKGVPVWSVLCLYITRTRRRFYLRWTATNQIKCTTHKTVLEHCGSSLVLDAKISCAIWKLKKRKPNC